MALQQQHKQHEQSKQQTMGGKRMWKLNLLSNNVCHLCLTNWFFFVFREDIEAERLRNIKQERKTFCMTQLVWYGLPSLTVTTQLFRHPCTDVSRAGKSTHLLGPAINASSFTEREKYLLSELHNLDSFNLKFLVIYRKPRKEKNVNFAIKNCCIVSRFIKNFAAPLDF